MRRGRREGLLERHTPDAVESIREEAIRTSFDPRRDLLFRRTAMRRVIFETAAFRRVMGRGDYNAIRQTGFANAIVSEDCVRDDRSRRVVVSFREHDIDVICREDFKSARQGWPGKRVRIDPEKQRTIDLLPLAVQTDCLRDGQNVPFIESPVEG